MPSRLLSLPRELRDMIYEFVACDNTIVVGRKKLVPRSRRYHTLECRAKKEAQYRYRQTNTGILLVNRQIHKEAYPIYYLESTFYLRQRNFSSFGFFLDPRMSRIRYMTRFASQALGSWKGYQASEKRGYCDLVHWIAQTIFHTMGHWVAKQSASLEISLVTEHGEIVWVPCKLDWIIANSEQVKKALNARER